MSTLLVIQQVIDVKRGVPDKSSKRAREE